VNDEIQKLIGKYTDGVASEAEVRELENILSADETLRAEFLEHVNADIAIEEHPDFPLYKSIADDEANERRSHTPKRIFPRWIWAAAATVGLLIAVGLTQKFFHSDGVPARVLGNGNVVVRGGDSRFPLGEQISLNEIDLEAGWLRLELPKGVVFDVYGPAKGHFMSADRFKLDSGRLNVDVGPLGKGFTVVTEHADIVDLGTQFGVDVSGDSAAKVAVFSGEVEVHSREGSSNPRLLEEGEGLRLESATTTSRLMSVNVADEDRPHRGLSESQNTFVIRDNLSSDDSLRYYGIVSNGMREGVYTYTTHKVVRWWSAENEPFPAELSGADLVQTFHRDRFEEDLEIQVAVERDSSIYVLFDERYETPEWLPEGLTDTGLTVRSGPWRPVMVTRDIEPDSNDEIYVSYRVWRTDVAAGESVTLGESKNYNRTSDQTWRVMYGIAVKPQF
jgi:hypothetical protein